MTITEQAQAVGDYWKAHPRKDDPRTWGGAQNFADAKQAYRAQHGSPPPPPTVPGPPTPGAGMAAARAGDLTAHGGTIGPVVTGVAARVLIGGKPVACVGDPHICPMFDGAKPHVGGTIATGSGSVLIGHKMVARVSDTTECKGPPGAIAQGEPSVLIGTSGG